MGIRGRIRAAMKRPAAEFLAKIHKMEQDPKSQVEFYLVDSMEITHFLPFYRELTKRGIRATFVAEPVWLNTAGGWFDFSTSFRRLKEQGIRVQSVANPDAKIAMTTQYPRNLSIYHHLKIQVLYGAVTYHKVNFSIEPDVANGFDYQFVHGLHTKRQLDDFLPPDHTKIMGYPRYIDYFHNQRDGITPSQNSKIQVSRDKPVLLYLPTWDEYSSIQDYADAIGKLRDIFNIVIKAHHCTWRLPEKIGDKEKLIANADQILPGTYSLAECAQLADIAICDGKSAVATEISYLQPNLPIILIMDKIHREEMEFNLEEFACGVYKPEELREKVGAIMRNDPYRFKREKILEDFYDRDTDTRFSEVIEFIVSKIK